MAVQRKTRPEELPPDQRKLTELQTLRLGAMSDLEPRLLAGLSVAEISEKFRFRIDPELLFFRRVCGRVVKLDPVTGVEYPVPYATVRVEDTDCSLLGYFPISARWSWFFPFHCRRETIATAVTDECGRFCVWIPRWDIDWVLRFRRERICFPIIFERPSLRDILEELIPERIPLPIPQPDPGPLATRGASDRPVLSGFDRGRFLALAEAHAGPLAARALDRASAQASFGRDSRELARVLDAPAFAEELPPPLPRELRAAASGIGRELNAGAASEAVRASLASRLKLDVTQLRQLDLRRFHGPFRRCFDVFVPEWVPIFDVPDVTFRVTQDTDGDGDEETIYSEGFFQVRWNSGPIGPLTLQAGPNARAGLTCDGDRVPCADVPAIVLAGRMPVTNVPTIYDHVSGYALRPNRPHPSGLFADPLPNPNAASPFMGAVSLFGCIKTDAKATHYRLQHRYSADGGVTFTSYSPFVGLTWPLFRLDGGGNPEWHYPTADAQGWYPINLPAGPNPFLPQDLILDWPTYAFANGRYVVKLELGTGGAVTSTSAEVAFNVDNSAPLGPLTIEWRKVGGGAFQLLVPPCPLVRRGSTPADLEFRVTLNASATHLRSAVLHAGGCGSGDFTLVSGTTEHWHVSTADNAEVLQAIFRLDSSAAQGTYGFSAHVASRAFNPNGGDGGHLILPDPWEYDPDVLHIDPQFAFSVINAD